MPSTAANPSAVRVLIAHRYLWPDNLSLYPAMLKDIVEWHVAQGHEVTVLAAQARETQRRLEWARYLNITLIEPRLGSDRGHGALWRLATMLGYCACLVRTLATHSFDIVLVSSNPPVAAATTVRWMARWGRYQYLYCLQDHFPEGMQRKTSVMARLIGRVAGWLDRKNVDAAAVVLTLSAGMKETLLRRGCHGRNLHVLQNFSVDDPEGTTKHASTEIPTLVFAGNLGALQNLPHFLRASKLAANGCPHKVQILGWGSEAERLKQLAVDEAMDHVEFHGVVPRDQAQRRIAECEAGVVAAAPCLFDIAYPSKTASYLTAGLPVLVFVEPDNPVAHELGQQSLGVAASPSDLTHASTAIGSLVRRLTGGDFQADKIQQQAARLFSKDNYFQGYGKVMTSLTASAATPRRRALMYSGICRGVSAKSQLVFLNEYARINNIDIVGSESEIVVFDYASVLQKYAKNPEANMDCILLFSVDLLPSDRALRDRVYRGALKNSLQVVFGAEDLVLSKAEDIQRIERLLESRPTLSTAAA